MKTFIKILYIQLALVILMMTGAFWLLITGFPVEYFIIQSILTIILSKSVDNYVKKIKSINDSRRNN